MHRNLKTLGMALAAILAIGAVGASGAAAQEGMLTSDGPVTLTGVEAEGGLNAYTAFGGQIECPGSTGTGHKVGATPHEFIESGATAITLTAQLANCEASGGEARTVDANGCDAVVRDAVTAGEGEGTYTGVGDLVCPANEEIQITGGSCTISIPPQTGLTGLHATNEAGGKIRISGTIHSITATACGFLHTSEAQQHVDLVISGHNELGEATGIEISH